MATGPSMKSDAFYEYNKCLTYLSHIIAQSAHVVFSNRLRCNEEKPDVDVYTQNDFFFLVLVQKGKGKCYGPGCKHPIII